MFVFYAFGLMVLLILEKLFGEEYQSIPFPVVQLLGMFILSNLFTYYAIFSPLDWFSFFVALVASVLLFVKLNRSSRRHISSIVAGFNSGPHGLRILAIILFLFTLVLGQYPPLIGDTGYYHAQSIRWLQEVGLVTGLGNLQIQHAQNHSWFILEAVFSIPWLNNSPLHIMNGLIFLILIFYCFDGIKEIGRKGIQFSSLLKLTILPFCIVYLSKYIASPSPDLPAAAIILINTIFCIERFEGNRVSLVDIAVLLVLSSYLITIKVSTLPLMIIVMYLVIRMKNLFTDNYRPVFFMLCSIIIVLMPWFISGYLLSGYFSFPFSEIDVFNVDWKIPEQTVINYKKFVYTGSWNPLMSGTEIKSTMIFDKRYYTFFDFPVSIISWVGTWLKQYSIQDKFLIFCIIGSIINLVFVVALRLFSPGKFFKLKQHEYFTVSIISLVAILLWFMNAPSIRFAYGFIILLTASQTSLWLLFFYQLADIKYQWCTGFFTLISIVLILFIIETQNFIVQRKMTEELYNTVAESVDSKGRTILETTYAFDHQNKVYRLKLFLSLMEKIRVLRTFYTSEVFDYYRTVDTTYPLRSDKGYYRPVDGLLTLPERIIFPSRYPVNPVKEVKLGDISFYTMSVPMKSWGGWYESFPFSLGNLDNLELRGSTLKQGFRVSK